MSATEYGAVNNDEETPLVSREIEHNETCGQKCKRILHSHRLHIIFGWIGIILLTALVTLGVHYFFKDGSPKIPEDPKDGSEGDVDMQCVSERSWFVALMLSIFLGPLGMFNFF